MISRFSSRYLLLAIVLCFQLLYSCNSQRFGYRVKVKADKGVVAEPSRKLNKTKTSFWSKPSIVKTEIIEASLDSNTFENVIVYEIVVLSSSNKTNGIENNISYIDDAIPNEHTEKKTFLSKPNPPKREWQKPAITAFVLALLSALGVVALYSGFYLMVLVILFTAPAAFLLGIATLREIISTKKRGALFSVLAILIGLIVCLFLIALSQIKHI